MSRSENLLDGAPVRRARISAMNETTAAPTDPFADVQPIRQRGEPRDDLTTDARPKQLQLSRRERWLRTQRNKATQTGLRSSNATLKTPGSHPGSRARVKLLTNARAFEIVSALSEEFYANAFDRTRPDSHRKQATASLGISLDKFMLLSSRPTSPAMAASDDQARSGVLELAQRLAAAATQDRSA